MRHGEYLERLRKGTDWYHPYYSAPINLSRSVLNGLVNGMIPGQIRRKKNRLIIRAIFNSTTPTYLKVYKDSWLKRCLLKRDSRSPAFIEAENLAWTRKMGINTLTILGLAEFNGPGIFSQSVLVTRELTGLISIPEALETASKSLTDTQFRQWKNNVIRDIAWIARTIHSHRHCHKDFYLCHFLVDQNLTSSLESWKPVHLIDLMRLEHYKWNWRRWMIKDLAQLLYSSDLPQITVQDRIHFLYKYLGVSRISRKDRRLLLDIVAKTRRYMKKNRLT